LEVILHLAQLKIEPLSKPVSRVTDYSDNFFGILVSQRLAGYGLLDSDIIAVLTEPVLLSKPDLHSFVF